MNHALLKGSHFGLSDCHQGNMPDPVFGKVKFRCFFAAPAALMGPMLLCRAAGSVLAHPLRRKSRSVG
jgi:hypothetical protein